MTDGIALDRAIAALKAGRAVRVTAGSNDLVILAVETASADLLALLDPDHRSNLLLSGRRAAALMLGNAREAADPGRPVVVAREAWLDADSALALADPGTDGARTPIGPLRPCAAAADRPLASALRLCRLAGLLPAAWLLPSEVDATAYVEAKTIDDAQDRVEPVARALLPLDGLPPTQIAVYRAADGAEHVALVVGAFGGRDPLVRLHSECLTGDVFGSLKCDCGPQLREALRIIASEGGGVLLYLRQEGRGIGLANKIRAYALQDRGFDTVDANQRLGFDDDERGYGIAAAILRDLGITRVRLLTNNPGKVAGLEAAGIGVAQRVAHHMPVNPHNADYLAVKQRRSGHLG